MITELTTKILMMDTKHEMVAYVQGYIKALWEIQDEVVQINPASDLVTQKLAEAKSIMDSLTNDLRLR